jgi:hypothetical protein
MAARAAAPCTSRSPRSSEVEVVYDDCLIGGSVGGTYTIKVRIKDGGTLAGCGASTTEKIAVAWVTR